MCSIEIRCRDTRRESHVARVSEPLARVVGCGKRVADLSVLVWVVRKDTGEASVSWHSPIGSQIFFWLSEFFSSICFSKVVASWQWANFVEAQKSATKRIVYVNMDETMIRLWQGGHREIVKVEPFANRKLFLDTEERGSLAERRQNCSMIAFISDCPEAQGLLPLILLLNEHHISKTAAQPIVEQFAANKNVVFLRRKSAWNSVELMVWIMAELRRRLTPLEPLAQVVLLLDCAPCHAHARVAHAAARNKVILVFLAASMTSSLQPLDVFVFASLKRYIRHAYERLILENDGAKCTERFLVELLHVSTDFIFGQNWQHAFRGCGFGAAQAGLTAHLRGRFPRIVPEGGISSELLSLWQLQHVWPSRTEIPIGWLFSLFTGEDVPPLPPPAPKPAAKSTQPGNVWFGRLRSSSSQALHVPDPSPSSSSLPAPWPVPVSDWQRSVRPVRPLRSYAKAVPAARPPKAPAKGTGPLSATPATKAAPKQATSVAVARPRVEPFAHPRPPPPKRRLLPVGRPLGLMRPRPFLSP